MAGALAADFDLTSLPVWLLTLAIFLLRCTETTLSTLRMLAVLRGRRMLAWLLGFCGSLLFASAVAVVLQSLDWPLNIPTYAAGFATGNVLGIAIEDRRAVGHSLLRIVSPDRGPTLIEALRSTGQGATELPGRIAICTATTKYCYIPRRDVPTAQRQFLALDPSAHVTVEHVR